MNVLINMKHDSVIYQILDSEQNNINFRTKEI